jgi:hypothetical protein
LIQRIIHRVVVLVAAFCALVLPLSAQQFDEKMWGKNSAGVELVVHEDARHPGPSATVLTFNLIGKGFPADKRYDLWFWNLGKKPQKAIPGVSFDKRGLLVCTGKPGECLGKGPDDPINIQATAMLGEPKRFAIVCVDGRVAGFAEAVPFPIEASDKKCKLSVVREAPLAEVVAVRANGFVPFEMLSVTGQFGTDNTAHSPSADPNGAWEAIMGTRAPGQTSGTATIKVAGNGCAVSVSFPWGEGSEKQQ